MKKIIILFLLMFFVQYFVLEAFFVRLDTYTPWDQSGNPMASALSFIISIVFCLTMIVILLIEKFNQTQFKKLILIILFLHCLLHFYREAFLEYDLFYDAKSFNTSSIITILTYFVVELILTFYVVQKLYKTRT